jgi:hypothetical protein
MQRPVRHVAARSSLEEGVREMKYVAFCIYWSYLAADSEADDLGGSQFYRALYDWELAGNPINIQRWLREWIKSDNLAIEVNP